MPKFVVFSFSLDSFYEKVATDQTDNNIQNGKCKSCFHSKL